MLCELLLRDNRDLVSFSKPVFRQIVLMSLNCLHGRDHARRYV